MNLDLWLVGFIVVSNAFWAWQHHALINKLMSKNFYDYKFTKDGPKNHKLVAVDDVSSHEEEDSILAELNGMLPK